MVVPHCAHNNTRTPHKNPHGKKKESKKKKNQEHARKNKKKRRRRKKERKKEEPFFYGEKKETQRKGTQPMAARRGKSCMKSGKWRLYAAKSPRESPV